MAKRDLEAMLQNFSPAKELIYSDDGNSAFVTGPNGERSSYFDPEHPPTFGNASQFLDKQDIDRPVMDEGPQVTLPSDDDLDKFESDNGINPMRLMDNQANIDRAKNIPAPYKSYEDMVAIPKNSMAALPVKGGAVQFPGLDLRGETRNLNSQKYTDALDALGQLDHGDDGQGQDQDKGARVAALQGMAGGTPRDELAGLQEQARRGKLIANLGRVGNDIGNAFSTRPSGDGLYDQLSAQAEQPVKNYIERRNLDRQDMLAKSLMGHRDTQDENLDAKTQHQLGMDDASGPAAAALQDYAAQLGKKLPDGLTPAMAIAPGGPLHGYITEDVLARRMAMEAYQKDADRQNRTTNAIVTQQGLGKQASLVNAKANAARVENTLSQLQDPNFEPIDKNAPPTQTNLRIAQGAKASLDSFNSSIVPVMHDLATNGPALWGQRRGELQAALASAQQALVALEQQGTTVPAMTKQRMESAERQLQDGTSVYSPVIAAQIMGSLQTTHDLAQMRYGHVLNANKVQPRTSPIRSQDAHPITGNGEVNSLFGPGYGQRASVEDITNMSKALNGQPTDPSVQSKDVIGRQAGQAPAPAQAKPRTVVKHQYSPSRNQTRTVYSDGSVEVADGK